MIDIRYTRRDDVFTYISQIVGNISLSTINYIRKMEKACIDGILEYGCYKSYVYKPDVIKLEFDLTSVSDMDYDMANFAIDMMIDFIKQLSKKNKQITIREVK